MEGADITITAGADNTNYYDGLGAFEADASQYINATLTQVPNLAISPSPGSPAEVVIKESDATIGLDGTTIDGSGAVSGRLDRDVGCVIPHGRRLGDGNRRSFAISVGYGQASSSAITTVTDSSITGGGCGRGHVVGDDHRGASGRGSARVRCPVQPVPLAIALAIANTSETSDRHDLAGLDRPVHGCERPDRRRGECEQLPDRRSPVGRDRRDVRRSGRRLSTRPASRPRSTAQSTACTGSPTATFNADPNAGPVAVNYQNSTITIPNQRLVDGTAVTYSNGGATSIGGLTNGRRTMSRCSTPTRSSSPMGRRSR